MKKNKVWKIRGYEGAFTDDELIELIWSGEIKPDFEIKSREMKEWIKLKDSIYEYFMEGRDDEVI